MKTVFSIIETPRHPNLTDVYQRLGLQQVALNSIRKANAALKKQLPDIVVAEFLYGYGNNYSGVHISNLDVFLVTLGNHGADAKIVVMVDPAEQEHVGKLNDIFPIHTVLRHPVRPAQVETELQAILASD